VISLGSAVLLWVVYRYLYGTVYCLLKTSRVRDVTLGYPGVSRTVHVAVLFSDQSLVTVHVFAALCLESGGQHVVT
jgi:hypothetical protein